MTKYKYTVIEICVQEDGCHEDIKTFDAPELAFEFKGTLTDPHNGYYEVLIEKG